MRDILASVVFVLTVIFSCVVAISTFFNSLEPDKENKGVRYVTEETLFMTITTVICVVFIGLTLTYYVKNGELPLAWAFKN